ncbi:MAG: hypothetical protein AW08_03912 [Candidatus Accumulibacter adjunctus]|uniref:Uncharacterized protein n=1 Tax=Candidatus Accumulibacter adjunctus TaxID=1454001 RepID=A0A011NH83_9PROT|nr:MAG: hypothetical protein AW08_03912 [Candidatus Accumulibacter adjunctus]
MSARTIISISDLPQLLNEVYPTPRPKASPAPESVPVVGPEVDLDITCKPDAIERPAVATYLGERNWMGYVIRAGRRGKFPVKDSVGRPIAYSDDTIGVNYTTVQAVAKWLTEYCDMDGDLFSAWYETTSASDTELPVPEASGAQRETRPGLTKQEILSVEWPLPPRAPPLKKILDEIPKWVDGACNRVGRPGKGVGGSHLWNPALLAHCLATPTPHKKWVVRKPELTKFLNDYFPDFLPQWEDSAEYL